MPSIDNGYLLTALTFGVYALGLWVAILVWNPIRLCMFGLQLPRGDPAAIAAFTLMAIYVLLIVATGTVWLGGNQAGVLHFILSGWSAGLLTSDVAETAEAEAVAPRLRSQFAFRRVMI
jgi:hypothetical protein